jgi:hypothetical protein
MSIPVSQACRLARVLRPRHHAAFHGVRAVVHSFVHKSVHKPRGPIIPARFACSTRSVDLWAFPVTAFKADDGHLLRIAFRTWLSSPARSLGTRSARHPTNPSGRASSAPPCPSVVAWVLVNWVAESRIYKRDTTGSPDYAVAQVGHAWCFEHADELKCWLARLEAIE